MNLLRRWLIIKIANNNPVVINTNFKGQVSITDSLHGMFEHNRLES